MNAVIPFYPHGAPAGICDCCNMKIRNTIALRWRGYGGAELKVCIDHAADLVDKRGASLVAHDASSEEVWRRVVRKRAERGYWLATTPKRRRLRTEQIERMERREERKRELEREMRPDVFGER